MRMRKKKWAEPWIEEHRDFVYQNPVENKGKWKELLQRDTLHSDPDSVDIVTHEETQEPYYVLTYQPGSVWLVGLLIAETTPVQK